jgi:tRNA modification GTPase
MSAKTGEGIHELEKAVKKIINAGTADPSEGMIANLRQLECINEAGDGAQAALGALADGMTLDAVSTGVAQALGGIAKLTGENVSEETINRVFEKFCVGK